MLDELDTPSLEAPCRSPSSDSVLISLPDSCSIDPSTLVTASDSRTDPFPSLESMPSFSLRLK